MLVRPANIEDAKGIAEVHVASWQTTYKGLIDDSFLESLSVESKKRSWEWMFQNPNLGEVLFVAVTETGEIIGFSNGGKCRDDESGFSGELYAIYLLQEYQRRGIGRELIQAIVNSLQDQGYRSLMLWVLESNPAINFYKKLGGMEVDRRPIMINEQKLVEVALGWIQGILGANTLF